MKKKILVVSTSPRMNGNSDTLANAFMKGALDAGHEVKKVNLSNTLPSFCKGCMLCQKSGRCSIHDEISEVIQEMVDMDVIVFATPIYFYEMSGQMKTFLDRTNPLFISDYKFKDIYLLATAADEELDTFDGAIQGLQGWISCFENTTLQGVLKGFKVDEYGSIKDHETYLKEAYALGNAIA